MRTIRLLVEYDGAAYCGWQVQPNGPTVQGALEEAVERLTGSACRVEGSGRTDRGVHARGQVAHFVSGADLPGPAWARALNAYLPKDISVRASEEAAAGFHARHDACGKRYCYTIENAPTRPVLGRTRCWWVSWKLDDAPLRAATEEILGRHDFTSFADAERGDSACDNVRSVTSAGWRRDGTRLSFTIEGEGFLYKMVRCLVGTFVEVARGRTRPEEIPRILAARDRRAAGPTAPPQGLCLERVDYPAACDVRLDARGDRR